MKCGDSSRVCGKMCLTNTKTCQIGGSSAFIDSPKKLEKVLNSIDPANIVESTNKVNGYNSQTQTISLTSEQNGVKQKSYLRHETGHHIDEQIPEVIQKRKIFSASNGKWNKTLRKLEKEIFFSEDEKDKENLQNLMDSIVTNITGKQSTTDYKRRSSTIQRVETFDVFSDEEKLPASKTLEFRSSVDKDLENMVKAKEINSQDIKDLLSKKDKSKKEIYLSIISDAVPDLRDSMDLALDQLDNTGFEQIAWSHIEEKVNPYYLSASILFQAYSNNSINGEDLIGSMSKNSLGKGHSDKYYSQSEDRSYSEVFANFTDLYALSSEKGVQSYISAALPNTYSAYENNLERIK